MLDLGLEHTIAIIAPNKFTTDFNNLDLCIILATSIFYCVYSYNDAGRGGFAYDRYLPGKEPLGLSSPNYVSSFSAPLSISSSHLWVNGHFFMESLNSLFLSLSGVGKKTLSVPLVSQYQQPLSQRNLQSLP